MCGISGTSCWFGLDGGRDSCIHAGNDCIMTKAGVNADKVFHTRNLLSPRNRLEQIKLRILMKIIILKKRKLRVT